MRQFIKILLLLTVIIFIQHNVWAEDSLKIGILDLQKCIDQSNEGKRKYQLLKEKRDTMQKRLNEKENELVEMQKEIEKQSMMLSLGAKEDKQKEFERKRRDLAYLLQDLNEEMNKAEAGERAEVLKDVEEIVKKIGDSGKYDLIIEKRTAGVIYNSDAIDITDIVIKEYNILKP